VIWDFFGILIQEAYGGLNLDLFYTYIFRGTSKNKIIWFAAAMWAHAYLAMTFKRKVMRRIKQDYLAQV
jgi:hypothetical protein